MRVNQTMLGYTTPAGAIEQWPTCMINGRPLDRASGGFTLHPVDARHFVVVPAGWRGAMASLETPVLTLDAAFRSMFQTPLEENDDE